MKPLQDEKVFKCTIHSFVRVTDTLIWKLIQTPEFQRLRRIKQLGGTHIVYPTAEHSRFSHSLGVYFIARRMIDVLKKQAIEFTEKERMLILCAALLHDVGHGPYSHSFESVLEVDHEEFTRRILVENTQINALLEGYQTSFSTEVSQVIEKTHSNKLIVSLISSELDADRLDYLLRDSYFTGTYYGQIDLERILRTMRVKDGEVVFKYSGMHALEHYLLSRYQMYWQVYLHDCSLSFNSLIKSLLSRVQTLLKEGYSFKTNMTLLEGIFLPEVIAIHTYLRMDDGVITTFAGFFLEEDDAILKDLARRFLNRGLLESFEYEQSEQASQLIVSLVHQLEEMGIDTNYYFDNNHHEQSTYDYYETDRGDAIALLMPDGSKREISEVSNIINGIVNEPKFKNTILLPLDLIEASDHREEVMTIVEQLLGRKLYV